MKINNSIIICLVCLTIISCTRQEKIPNGFIKEKLNNYHKKPSEKDIFTYYCPVNAISIDHHATNNNKIIRKLHDCDFSIIYDMGFSFDIRTIQDLNCYLLFEQKPRDTLSLYETCIWFDNYVKTCNRDVRQNNNLFFLTHTVDTSNTDKAIINIAYKFMDTLYPNTIDSIRYCNQEIILYKDYRFSFSMMAAVSNQKQIDSLHNLSQIILNSIRRED